MISTTFARICVCLSFSCLAAQAQVLPVREIEAPGWGRGGEDDLFGYALAMDGTDLVVGIPGAPTTSAPGDGMVEVYEPSPGGWVLRQTLFPEQNSSDEKFGIALAQSGDDLVVGSWDAGFGNGLAPGSAHAYRRVSGSWQLPQRLAPVELDSDDAFGSVVAVSGDWLAVSAPRFDDETGIRGAVFLYRRNGSAWDLVQRIEGTDSTRSNGFSFGCGMAMATDRLYIGDCFGDSAQAPDTGAVYWYQLGVGGAVLGGSIPVADAEPGDEYGYAIAATGTHVIIAAAIGNPDSENRNRVYVLARDGNGHTLQHRQLFSSFVASLHLAADRALVAGPVCDSATTPGRRISCVQRLDRSGQFWTLNTPYLHQPEAGFTGFGVSITADAQNMHVGHPFRDMEAGPSTGAISSFDLAAPGTLPKVLMLPAGLWRFAFNTVFDGDFMIATDPQLATPDDLGEGTAWFFDIGGGAQLLSRIDTPEPYTYERFANDVAVVGDRVVLLATRRVQGGRTIVLRTYQRNGGTIDFVDEFDVLSLPELQEQTLNTSFEMEGDRLALSGGVETLRGLSPRIWVLRRQGNTWELEAALQPPAQDEEVAINLSSLAMHGDRIVLLRGDVAPAPADPRGWVCFVYRRVGTLWSLEQSLRPALGDPPATVLHSLAIHGDGIALSTGDTLQNTLVSRIHTFRFDGAAWVATGRIDQPTAVSNFGRHLALEGDALVVETFPLAPISNNFVVPLRLYRRDGDSWYQAGSFLPQLYEGVDEGRFHDFGLPILSDGRLFASGRREGPSVTTHAHGVIVEFDLSDPLFADSLE